MKHYERINSCTNRRDSSIYPFIQEVTDHEGVKDDRNEAHEGRRRVEEHPRLGKLREERDVEWGTILKGIRD